MSEPALPCPRAMPIVVYGGKVRRRFPAAIAPLYEDEGSALDRAVTRWVRAILIGPPDDIHAASRMLLP